MRITCTSLWTHCFSLHNVYEEASAFSSPSASALSRPAQRLTAGVGPEVGQEVHLAEASHSRGPHIRESLCQLPTVTVTQGPPGSGSNGPQQALPLAPGPSPPTCNAWYCW